MMAARFPGKPTRYTICFSIDFGKSKTSKGGMASRGFTSRQRLIQRHSTLRTSNAMSIPAMPSNASPDIQVQTTA